MVTALAIYSAIGITWSLAKQLGELMNEIRKDASTRKVDLEGIVLKFQDNLQKVGAFKEGFEAIKDELNPEFQLFVERSNRHLYDKLDDAKHKIAEHYNVLKWVWVKKDMKAAADALQEWSGCFEARFALLPQDLKTAFENKFVSLDYKARREGPLAELFRHIDLVSAKLKIEEEDPEKILLTMKDEVPDLEERDIRHFQYYKDPIPVPEHIQADPAKLREFKLEVGRLVEVLRAANPRLTYLPTAVSWFQRPPSREATPQTFGIAYHLGDFVKTRRSLKEVIDYKSQQQFSSLPQIPQYSLSNRVKLALEFVSAMAYLRGLGWVHKAIRPSNIILCYNYEDEDDPHSLGRLKLVGFNVARRGSGEVKSSSQDNERRWFEQIYSHPKRQTLNKMAEDAQIAQENAANEGPTKAGNTHHPTVTANSTLAATRLPYYTYMHDIYSVGVVLLEIGLWQDLTVNPGAKVFREARPEARQQKLIELAKDQLPPRVGNRYASVVKSCLEVDKDGPEIKDVLSKLAQIQV